MNEVQQQHAEPLKAGDRVKVYSGVFGEVTGTIGDPQLGKPVRGTYAPGCVAVDFDELQLDLVSGEQVGVGMFHPKQCRRLKRRERRRLHVAPKVFEKTFRCAGPSEVVAIAPELRSGSTDGWLEFVEVRRK
jgi:hypothetical protein